MEKIPGGEWFTGAGLGMFIHWDHASSQGIEIGWPITGRSIIPGREKSEDDVSVDQYHSSASNFNPVNWNADTVAEMAKNSGAQYVVFTSRHHGGYSMFHTKHSDFSIEKSPFKRDILRELVDSLRKRNLRVGIYYILSDWHHQDYPKFLDSDRPYPKEHFPEANWPENYGLPIKEDKHRRSSPEAWARYLDYVRGQLEELLTNYGQIDLLWFDGGWERSEEEWGTPKLREFIKAFQPNVIINERLIGSGDYFTPEQSMPRHATPRTWEMCMTIGEHWGWKPNDLKKKSTRQVLVTLIEVVSRGGNLLLNTGIKGDGGVEEKDKKVFDELSQWMKLHRESVIGVMPGTHVDFYGPVTQTKDAIYLHLVMQPKNRVTVRGVPLDRISNVEILSTNQKLEFSLNFEVHHRAKPGEERMGELVIHTPIMDSELVEVIKVTLK